MAKRNRGTVYCSAHCEARKEIEQLLGQSMPLVQDLGLDSGVGKCFPSCTSSDQHATRSQEFPMQEHERQYSPFLLGPHKHACNPDEDGHHAIPDVSPGICGRKILGSTQHCTKHLERDLKHQHHISQALGPQNPWFQP